jgi:hypothetical protein
VNCGVGRMGRASLVILAFGGVVQAQGTLTLGVPFERDSIPPAPSITANVTGVDQTRCPCVTSIDVSASPTFVPLIEGSTTAPGLSATFRFTHLLPERTRIYFRGRAFDRAGTLLDEQTVQGVTRARLRLVSPTTFNAPVFTRRPTFTWSSSSVTNPPGPWLYDLAVVNTVTQAMAFNASGLTDTVFTLPTPLEANTSYQWRVRARINTGDPADETTVTSPTTFVISSADAPLATLLYNTFPNPFPNAVSGTACIWFDLAVPSKVSLTVYDIVGPHRVRVIFTGDLAAGAHGRSSPTGGCESRFSWDGRDDRGRFVQPGAYILRFHSEADGVKQNVTLRYRGR